MLLILDFGNTRLKYFLGQNELILQMGAFQNENFWKELQELITKQPKITAAVAADVRGILTEEGWKTHCKIPLMLAKADGLKLPFTSEYTTLETFGQDRLAFLAGAQQQYPKRDVLLIDMGTCITYDVLTAEGVHKGGSISPGINMRYASLQQQTRQLPKLEYQALEAQRGKSTAAAIHTGVVFGVLAEIDAQIAQAQSEYPNLTVILGGGDAQKLSKKIKKAIFAHPNLLALGLYKLWRLNSTT